MTGATASCHRIEPDIITDPKEYSKFHNTPTKLSHRHKMINGEWPGEGCEYCRDLEAAGGVSDRLEIMNKSEFYPREMYVDNNAIEVTPRILEVYFNNTCNMGCIYCGSQYSSVWEAEERKWGVDNARRERLEELDVFRGNYPRLLEAHWEWFKTNGVHLAEYRILGGEPFFQDELEKNIDLIYNYPCPDTILSVFSNLKVPPAKLTRICDKLQSLIDANKLKAVRIICSLDSWGAEQEYIRSGLNLQQWEDNFLTLLHEYEFELEIHGTITNLSMPTLPDLCENIAEWNKTRKVWHSMCLVTGQKHMEPGIFPDGYWDEQWDRAIEASAFKATTDWLRGAKAKSNQQPYDRDQIRKLQNELDNLDYRRDQTSWRKLFTWLHNYEL